MSDAHVVPTPRVRRLVRVLPPPLQDERDEATGRRILSRDLSCDLGEYIYELHEKGYYGASLSPEGDTILTVPKGFDTDYSSVPNLLSPIMGRWDTHDLAGVFHDWCYRVQIPRRIADRVWRLVAMSGVHRVSTPRAWLGWAGLRAFGFFAYRKHKSNPQNLRLG